jgi:broad specificity phosphatase PhoE
VKARRIILWRHGRTEWNAEQRFQGQSDIPLDDVGRQQAAQAARLLQRLEPARIISSDLMRARETAEALASLVARQVDTDERLRETYAGSWQGLTRRELEEQFPDELASWSAGSQIRPGGGETRVEVADRMVAAIDEALTTLEPGQTLVVATHGGAARAATGALLGLPLEHWAALGVLTNCAWSVLAENVPAASGLRHGPPWRLQEYNAGSLPVVALADDR